MAKCTKDDIKTCVNRVKFNFFVDNCSKTVYNGFNYIRCAASGAVPSVQREGRCKFNKRGNER